jgi:D-amino-acid dehydrogenase
MEVLIMGGGVIGITTAYYLSKHGYKVTIIEKNSELAQESSFSNGGHLGYSSITPGEYPSIWLSFLRLLENNILSLENEIQLWQLTRKSFFNNLLNKRNKYALELIKLSLYRLGLFSKKCLNEILIEANLTSVTPKPGILHLYSNDKRYSGIISSIKNKHKYGYNAEILSREECYNLEPALASMNKVYRGGIYFPDDFVSDCYVFCQALKDVLYKNGVKFIFNTDIFSIIQANGTKIEKIIASNGEFKADKYIVALGVGSTNLLNKLGINIPVYPLKGYSLSLELEEQELSLTKGISDATHKIYISQFGNILRCAGTQEKIGLNYSVNEKQVEIILKSIAKIFPSLNLAKKDLSNKIFRRACLRPATDGFPIIGQEKYSNLYLNTGHGGLGWTLACGSAKLLTNLILKSS